MKRSGRGAARPSASDECDFEKGERAEYGRPPSSFGTSAPLSTTHSLSLSPSLPSPRQTLPLPLTPLPSSLLYQLPPRQPTNLSFVSLPRQLRLSQVDTQLQNIQFERKVKTKWIFQREYSRCQKPALSLPDDSHVDSRCQKKMQVNGQTFAFSYVVPSKSPCTCFSLRVLLSLVMDIRIMRTQAACNVNCIALPCRSKITLMLLTIVSLFFFALCLISYNNYRLLNLILFHHSEI